MNQEQTKIIKLEILKYLQENKHKPVRLFFAKFKEQTKVLKNLKEVAVFFEIKEQTMRSYNSYKKHNIGGGKIFFPIIVNSVLGQILNDY